MQLQCHNKTLSNRHLKIAENIRRALSTIISFDLHDPVLEKTSVTISEVKLSQDLRVANVYLLPLIGSTYNKDEFFLYMKDLTPKIRYSLSQKLKLRYTPEIRFILDSTFDQVIKLEDLLKKK